MEVVSERGGAVDATGAVRRALVLALVLALIGVLASTKPVDAVASTTSASATAATTTTTTTTTTTQPGAWAWPVQPAVLSNAYAAPPTPYAAGHRGIDLAVASGTGAAVPVTAPARATVKFVGTVVDRPVLTLDHGDGILSSYEPLASELALGTELAPGQLLGHVADGGHCADTCLHVGVRLDGEYVSPLLFFDRVPRAVLLPLHPSGSAAAER